MIPAADQAALDARVAAAVAEARQRIDAVAGGRSVRLVAVTKGFGPAEVLAACRAGVDACGENYAQELLAKTSALAEAGEPLPSWHFVGRLQRNKVRQLAPHVALWESIDRVELGAEVARRSPGAPVLVQCNISGESAKGGCAPAEVPEVVSALSDLGLEVRGLMGVAAAGPRGEARRAFDLLVGLADRLGLVERSIGMSGDFEEAVAAGATMVRLGTVVFGRREQRARPEPPGATAG